ncbi:MAG: cbb3-type cytochrome c oxidase subunit I [Holophagales bacterium]|nr:cbb3-type cytochrome c oxidase subunit I [Holophagales bacterium]
MSAPASPAETGGTNYLNATHGIGSWLLTRDHKRIGILYLLGISVFFVLGGLMAVLIRAELATPQGDLFSSDVYNRLFTMHGILMIFFFLIPSIPAVLGNFLLPIMIGAKDLAFPRLNLAQLVPLHDRRGDDVRVAPDGRHRHRLDLLHSDVDELRPGQVIVTAVGIFVAGFSSILTGLNFIVTIHRMRAPGLTWFRLPLFVWAHYATSIIQILGTPVIAITILLVGAERLFHIGVFDPKYGGDPVLFQHLFWFYSHPAVYIMILPAMGVMSELVTAFSRKRVFGYHFIAFSSLFIAVIGFLVWGHHMFISGQSVVAGAIFSFLTMLVAIPSAVKVFNWTATLYKGSISLQTPMLYALGFIGVFLIGGLTGVMLGTLGINIYVHDTYFIVAHFHYVMVGSAIMGYLGGLHFWWPKITGRMYNEFWSKISAIVIFIGFNTTFFPQFILGYLGMPRRYHMYPAEFQTWNVLSSAGATILGFGYLMPVVYLLWSLKFGAKAPANPWGAKGLEWETSSPPPVLNFATPPVVTEEAYAYETSTPAKEVTVGV